jgi:hypothetical protein
VQFIDAREHPEIVRAFSDRGIDLNRDFVLRLGTAEYIGGDAVFVLASLGTKWNFFRKLNARLFRSRSVSLAVYRLMRIGRRLLLLLLGRPLLVVATRDSGGIPTASMDNVRSTDSFPPTSR